MPKPIPEWDYFRTILVYTLKKQENLTPPTLQNLCNRLGLSAGKIFAELNEQSVEYRLVQRTEKYKLAGVELIIKSIPERLEGIFGVNNKKILAQYEKLMRRKIVPESEKDWVAVNRQKREKIKRKKLKYFLRE